MKTPEHVSTRLTAWLAALLLSGTAAWLPAASAEETAAAAPAAAEAAAGEEAAPAAEATVEAAGEQAPAAQATAAAAEEETPAEASTAAVTETAAPAALRYRDRGYLDARRELMRENARLRRENLERWRTARRWWNNPVAEDRRQRNKARSRWFRDMAEARQQAYEQLRPDWSYSYSYRRGYPY